MNISIGPATVFALLLSVLYIWWKWLWKKRGVELKSEEAETLYDLLVHICGKREPVRLAVDKTHVNIYIQQSQELYDSIPLSSITNVSQKETTVRLKYVKMTRAKTLLAYLQRKRFSTIVELTLKARKDIEATQFAAFLKDSIFYKPGNMRKIFVLINPVSGTMNAVEIYRSIIEPILQACEWCEVQSTVTEYSGHARDIVSSLPGCCVDTIVCVGGDGLIFEVANGILKRSDAERFSQIPLAAIPCGTGNGLCKSVGLLSIETAALAVVHGHPSKLDVMKVTSVDAENNPPTYCVLQISYGIISDVDFDSEKIRFLGDFRFSLYGLYRILFPRYYKTKLTFKLSPKHQNIPEKYQRKSLLEKFSGHHGSTDGWYTIEIDLIWLLLANTTYCSADAQGARYASINDGSIDMTIAGRSASYLDLLGVFLNLESGNWIDIGTEGDKNDSGGGGSGGGVTEYYKVSHVLLQPCFVDQGKLDLDGEPLTPRSVSIECLPGALTILTSKWSYC